MKIRHPETGQIIEVEGDPTEAELDSMFAASPSIKQKEDKFVKQQESEDASDILFPRTARALKEGRSYPYQMGASALDILSGTFGGPLAAGRMIDTKMGLAGDKPQSFLESYKQISEGKDVYGKPDLISEIIGDPTTPLGAGVGGLGAKWLYQGGRFLPKAVGIGLGEGAVTGGARQAEKVIQGEDPSLKEFVTETAVSGAIPAVLQPVSKLVNKSLGALSSQLSNVSEESLRKWGFGIGQGAKELKAMSGKQRDIGKNLLDALDNFDEFIPEKQIVDEALSKMPPVSTSNISAGLDKAIEGISLKASNKGQIAKLKNNLKDIRSKGDMISAEEFKNLRGDIDKLIDWSDNKMTLTNNILKDVRTSMKDELVNVAEQSGNPQYKEAMMGWTDKLQKRDALLEEIGASSKTRNKRIGTFMSTLFNKNKDTRREALKNVQDIFGEDFMKQANLVQMADEILQPGSNMAKFLPNQTTGKATTALAPGLTQFGYGMATGNPLLMKTGLATMTAASPALSSKTLTVAELMEFLSTESGTRAAGRQLTGNNEE